MRQCSSRSALPLRFRGSGYRDWMTIKSNAAGAWLWGAADATPVNDEVPDWVTVDGANAVYRVGHEGDRGPSTERPSFSSP